MKDAAPFIAPSVTYISNLSLKCADSKMLLRLQKWHLCIKRGQRIFQVITYFCSSSYREGQYKYIFYQFDAYINTVNDRGEITLGILIYKMVFETFYRSILAKIVLYHA